MRALCCSETTIHSPQIELGNTFFMAYLSLPLHPHFTILGKDVTAPLVQLEKVSHLEILPN